jgi:hypothetical protein
MARAHSGCEVWQQDFLKLDLPDVGEYAIEMVAPHKLAASGAEVAGQRPQGHVLAQRGHATVVRQCPLSGVKRTLVAQQLPEPNSRRHLAIAIPLSPRNDWTSTV